MTTHNAPDTHTQLRATCPVCFAKQATTDGRLVNHGYRRPRGWQQNVNTCPGAGKPHFGTPGGRATTARYAVGLRDAAQLVRHDAEKVASGELPLRDRRGHVIETPAPWQRVRAADGMVAEAGYMDTHAADLDKLVAEWTPAEPVVVTVASKGGPLLHLRRANWGRHCAASRMAAITGSCTADRAQVTCPKCLARLAAREATLAAAQAS